MEQKSLKYQLSPSDIKDRIELVSRLTNDLNAINEEIRDITDEKSRLLIQAGNIPESVLEAQIQ